MPPVLRPLALGELLDHTFQLYRKKFLLFVGIAAIPHLIVLIVQVALQSAIYTAPSAAFSPGMIAAGVAVFGLAMLLYLCATAVSQAAIAVAVSETYMGREISIWGTYSKAKGKFLSVLALMIGLGIATAFGLLLLIIPGIYLMLTWCLTIPALMVEDLSVTKAPKRSSQLVNGARWRMLLIMFLLFALTYAVMLGLQMPILFIMIAAGQKMTLLLQIVNQFASFVAGSLVAPLGMIAFTVAYYDQRVRKEGFDIQLLMASQMQPSATAATAGGMGTASN